MTSQLHVHALCMHSVYSLANVEPMEVISSSSSSASDDDGDDDELLDDLFPKKFCVLFCMTRNAPECTPEHLKLPEFPGGDAPRPP